MTNEIRIAHLADFAMMVVAGGRMVFSPSEKTGFCAGSYFYLTIGDIVFKVVYTG